MAFDSERLLDSVGWKLLTLLQEDARRSYSQLGREVGLSGPAVAERVRRLEEAGIITGYHAAISHELVGLPILALIRLSGVSGQAPRVQDVIAGMPEVRECYRVTGGDSYLLKVVATSIGHLETIIDQLIPYGEVTTALVLSTPIARRVIRQPG